MLPRRTHNSASSSFPDPDCAISEGDLLFECSTERGCSVGFWVVDEVGTALQTVAEEQGRPFRWEAPSGLNVRGSEPLLKRVLLNLVDNAFRHTAPTAGVVVRAERDDRVARLIVADEGDGIAADVAPHVFERFRHGHGDGTGLGLALVREIVERHGGSVTLESAPGAGTTARVVLPLAS